MDPHFPVHIRPAIPADATILADLGRSTFLETYEKYQQDDNFYAYIAETFTRDKIAAEITAPGTGYYLALVGAEAVGYTRYRREVHAEGERAVVQRIYVRGDWQGRGVGRQLMTVCTERAQEEGFDGIYLTVWPVNTPAVAFYQHIGFTLAGTVMFQLRDVVEEDFLMYKPLA
ncbi:MAG: GNAT family N-acetyltransferase [Bacteroidia bacterium]|jgi:ribosomal protein S18 acetylase RimI-like enzyme|nr:GNAT family N-acetyltransferase [Bacteroidia bacterium]